MKKETLSIIIPVYNGANTIQRTIDSLICEEILSHKVEVIVVNDGSIDQTHYVLETYSKLPIVIVDKPNGGVSSARNEGLKRAKGKYVYFADADDFVHIEALIKLLGMVEESKSDLAIASYQTVLPDGSRTLHSPCSDLGHHVAQVEFTQIIKDFLCRKIGYLSSLCNKIFSMDIIKQNGLIFDTHRTHGEDWAFVISYLLHCKDMLLSNLLIYDYLQDGTQIIEKYGPGVIRCWPDSVRLQKNLASHIGVTSEDSVYKNMQVSFWGQLNANCHNRIYSKQDKKKMLLSQEAKEVYNFVINIKDKELKHFDLSRRDKCMALLCRLKLFDILINVL